LDALTSSSASQHCDRPSPLQKRLQQSGIELIHIHIVRERRTSPESTGPSGQDPCLDKFQQSSEKDGHIACLRKLEGIVHRQMVTFPHIL